jgi:hypothetical protein
MNTYNWIIEWVETSNETSTNPFTVLQVGWRCNGFTEGKEYSTSIYSSVSLPAPKEDGKFIEYKDLTENIILKWIWNNGVDKQVTEEAIDKQLEAISKPVTIKPTLPWATTTQVVPEVLP